MDAVLVARDGFWFILHRRRVPDGILAVAVKDI